MQTRCVTIAQRKEERKGEVRTEKVRLSSWPDELAEQEVASQRNQGHRVARDKTDE